MNNSFTLGASDEDDELARPWLHPNDVPQAAAGVDNSQGCPVFVGLCPGSEEDVLYAHPTENAFEVPLSLGLSDFTVSTNGLRFNNPGPDQRAVEVGPVLLGNRVGFRVG